MFAGPIIAREVLTAPRPLRFYLLRAAFATGIFILMWTAWQSLVGWREVLELGVLARFGSILYLLISLLQLTFLLFFAPLSAATAVSHEKDRRTFLLLLMTDLSDLEIVLGKLAASFVLILTVLVAGLPVLTLCALLGGISFWQITNLYAVTISSGLTGGAMGLLIALWRDRTFQSVSLTILFVVLSIVAVEGLAAVIPDFRIFGVTLVEALNPYRAMLSVLYPAAEQVNQFRTSSLVYIVLRLGFATLLVAFGTHMLRKWNPGKSEPREQREESLEEVVEELAEVEEVSGQHLLAMARGAAEPAATSGPGWSGPAAATATTPAVQTLADGNGDGDGASHPPAARKEFHVGDPSKVIGDSTGLHVPRRTHRRVAPPPRPYRKPWDNPILWRELQTRGYGTKPIIIKGLYVLIFAMGVVAFHTLAAGVVAPLATNLAMIPLALAILSLLLVNAQGVTALTSERDSGALDLLLVTELSPRSVHLRQALRRPLQHQGDDRPALALDDLPGRHPDDLGRERRLPDHRLPAALPLRGDARSPRGDHVHQQPDGRRPQPRHDVLPDGRHRHLRLPHHPQRPRVRPPVAQFHDLHRRRQRGAVSARSGRRIPRRRLRWWRS